MLLLQEVIEVQFLVDKDVDGIEEYKGSREKSYWMGAF